MDNKWFIDKERMDMVGRWRLNGLLRTMRKFDFIVGGEVMVIPEFDYSLDPESGMICGESIDVGVHISVWGTSGRWYADDRIFKEK